MNSSQPKIKIGVSSCLLGESVRYDGGHKREHYIVEELSQQFELVGFCPEVSIGLGIPRPPIELVKRGQVIVCLGVDDNSVDVTDALLQSAQGQFKVQQQLSGYIVKAKSPSCGLTDVKVLTDDGYSKIGSGLFTQRLQYNFAKMPIIEEGQLDDVRFRAQFIQRVHGYYHWQLSQLSK